MKNIRIETHLIVGIILILISSIIYQIETLLPFERGSMFSTAFFIHYLIAIAYAIVICFKFQRNCFKIFRGDLLPAHTLLLVLFNISAYSLNNDIPVFYESSDWFTIFLIGENTFLIAISFFNLRNDFIKSICFLVMGIMAVVNLYLSFMVLPFSFFGIVGVLFLGISLHLFVPIFYLIAIFAHLKSIKWNRKRTIYFSGGIILCLVFCSYSIIQWIKIENIISDIKLSSDAPLTEKNLPEWVAIAQRIPANNLTEDYLKGEIVYQVFNKYDFFDMDLGPDSYDEKKVHDPLISIAQAVSGKTLLNRKDKIQILNFLYDKRHQSADRFWSGNNLTTDQVVANIEVFPKERLTFTEMIFTVSNNYKRSNWQKQEEGIYTFTLPRGGVVTSLSLWINGKEEKAILTTKSKAKKAYNTIVGRELRDPSVAYWMEGNKVRIRVFPCTPNEKRKFKVGITSPLELEKNQLCYRPIEFQGPDFSNAKSAIYIVQKGIEIESEYDFKHEGKLLVWKGKYKPDWSFRIESKPLDNISFSFQNRSYALSETRASFIDFTPQNIYLDLSSHWEPEELELIKKHAKGKKLIAFDKYYNQILNPEIELFHINFSLFPYYKINEKNAIVITKGGMNTPNLADLENTKYHHSLFKFFNQYDTKINVYDLAKEPSDLNKSLMEFGVISYHQIDMNQLKKGLSLNKFPDIKYEDNQIIIPSSGVTISEKISNNHFSGSDHLMRLYSYQKVMNTIGKDYFSMDKSSLSNEENIQTSSEANILTPISSLIVLETQKDYERFNIKKNKGSLGNASINNAGAVPEPHEWALILIGASFALFLFIKSRLV